MQNEKRGTFSYIVLFSVSRVNDRITSANGISLENVDYGRAVQVLRDSGNSVTLSVRRRLLLPSQEPHILRVQLNKSRKKDGKLF